MPCLKLTKEIQTTKERKDRAGGGIERGAILHFVSAVLQAPLSCSIMSLFSEPILGKGMRRSTFLRGKKGGFSVKGGEAIQWIRGVVRISTGKAIQWRGPGHSLNRRTLKTEKLLSSSPSRKSALIFSEQKKLEKAGTVDFKKHPAETLPEFSSGTPDQTPETATAFSSFLIFYLKTCTTMKGTPWRTACFTQIGRKRKTAQRVYL